MPRIAYPTRRLQGVRPAGETILEAVRALGYVMDHACGGNARCGTCCVKVVSGEANLSAIERDERDQLGELGVGPPHRLACRARLQGEVVVIPGH